VCLFSEGAARERRCVPLSARRQSPTVRSPHRAGWSASEATQVRHLDEHAAPRRLIRPDAGDPLILLKAALLDERAVAGVEERAGPELVRREKIGQRLILRAVELHDGAQEEVAGELIRRLGVEDADRVDALAGRVAIERDALEIDRLRES